MLQFRPTLTLTRLLSLQLREEIGWAQPDSWALHYLGMRWHTYSDSGLPPATTYSGQQPALTIQQIESEYPLLRLICGLQELHRLF